MEGKPEGLRARKKRATREAIAATAHRLFAERGFDAVTVAEIAAAADVSEKTVFNHFAAKEDLVFAGGEARLSQLLKDIAERPAGVSVLDVFRARSEALLDDIAAGRNEDMLIVPRIVRGSPALQERMMVGWERDAGALTAAVAAAAGAQDGDIVPAVVARTLLWAHRSVFRAAFTGLLAGEDRAEVVARVRPQAARAYGALAEGLREYGVAAAGDPPAR